MMRNKLVEVPACVTGVQVKIMRLCGKPLVGRQLSHRALGARLAHHGTGSRGPPLTLKLFANRSILMRPYTHHHPSQAMTYSALWAGPEQMDVHLSAQTCTPTCTRKCTHMHTHMYRARGR